MKEKIIFCVRNMEMVGGKERAVAKIASALSDQYAIGILNLEPSVRSFYEIDPKVQLYSCQALDFLGKAKGFKTGLLFVRGIKNLIGFMKHENPTILVGNDFLVNIMLVLASFFVRNKAQVIGWEHVTLQEPIINARPKLRKVRDFFYKKLKRLVVITQSDASFCKQKGIKAVLIPYPKSFSFSESIDYAQPRILTIARLSYQKGIDLLIALIATLKSTLQAWRFILVAKEDDITFSQLQTMIDQAGVADCLEVQPPSAQVIQYYRQASIFLLTSRYEGLPITLIEAQTCGLPCVSFDCKTGPADIISHDVDGFIVPTFDIQQMAAYLLRLTQDEEMRKRMGLHAKESSKRFDEAQVIAKWHQLIAQLKKVSTKVQTNQ